MNIRSHKTVSDRRKTLEKELQVDLKNIGSFTLDEEVAGSRNCENMIGVAQVPLGLAGPLRVRTQNPELNDQHIREYYIPLATTEGALVASVNRGCKAITESGGVATVSERVGATRGPVFQTDGLGESLKLKNWLDENFPLLDQQTQRVSRHLRLIKLGTRIAGRRVYVRFYFDTQDAMGMNMATIATDAAARIIEQKTGIKCLALAGNFDIDKKPGWLNFISGRGFRGWAEATIPASILSDVLKTTPQSVYEVWLAKCMVGSAMAGSMGYNSHFANVIAAIFIATGQDPAHVVEGSLGITTCEALPPLSFRPEPAPYSVTGSRNPDIKKLIPGQDFDGEQFGPELTAEGLSRTARDDKKEEESLYVSVYLPDLMVGTVGGGTGLATQKEALSILGVAGGNEGRNAQRFAEIVAAAVLAGEISLLASLAEGTLAKAHQRLARGKQT